MRGINLSGGTDVEEKYGGSGVDKEVIDWIRENVTHGSVILELGSGAVSTGNLSKQFTMYSIEDNANYVGQFKSTYFYIPLVNEWYKREHTQSVVMNLCYSVLLIDGPSNENYRIHFLENYDLFDVSVPWIFHDTNRPTEREVVNSISTLTKKKIIYDGGFFVVML
jgi:hypothetical protein